MLGCTRTRLAPAPLEAAGQPTIGVFDVNNPSMLWCFGGRGRVQEERPHEEYSASRNDTDLLGDSFSPHWYLFVAKPPSPMRSRQHFKRTIARIAFIYVKPQGEHALKDANRWLH